MALLKINSFENISVNLSETLMPLKEEGTQMCEPQPFNLNYISELADSVCLPKFEFSTTNAELRLMLNELRLLEGTERFNIQFFNPGTRFHPVFLYWDYGKIPLTLKKATKPLEFGGNNSRVLLQPQPIWEKQKIQGAFNLMIFVLTERADGQTIEKQIEFLNELITKYQLQEIIHDFSSQHEITILEKLRNEIQKIIKTIKEGTSQFLEDLMVFSEATFTVDMLESGQSFKYRLDSFADLDIGVN